jgi:glycosyltransferase involved in cell wall biosynthesis
MKLFVKIVPNEFKNASRNKRELSVVNTLDVDIIVMAKGEYNYISNSDGYTVHRRTTRPLGNANWLVSLNRTMSIFTWASHARKLKADCISCHDLIALFIGWISTWFVSKKKKPLLVYDSHEFELGRNTEGKRSEFQKCIIQKLEKFLMKKCAVNIMVNDSISNEVQRIHNLKEKPIVVRNTPNYWVIDDDICIKRRKEICARLRTSEDTFIVMYHGSIMRSRGIESLLTSLSKNKNIVAVILGDGEMSYLKQLKHRAEKLQISDRVLFHDAVPVDILWQYVGAADVGMITLLPVTQNHYLALPNKFFENIQSLTPIICSNFPEVSTIVKKYDIGLMVNPEKVDEIVAAIDKMQTNREMYTKFKNNLNQAKENLCWENERKVLERAYGEILSQK